MTGMTTTPSAARPWTARPIITANSGTRSANSRVPSSGSTNQTRSRAERRRTSAGSSGTLSSARTASPGNDAASAAQIISLASRSARVTGSLGPFSSTVNGVA